MNAKYFSQVSKRIYKIDVTVDGLYSDTGCKVYGYYAVVGWINGQSVLRRAPVSIENVDHMKYRMERDLEVFLEGRHHVTQYANFPEIAEVLNAKII